MGQSCFSVAMGGFLKDLNNLIRKESVTADFWEWKGKNWMLIKFDPGIEPGDAWNIALYYSSGTPSLFGVEELVNSSFRSLDSIKLVEKVIFYCTVNNYFNKDKFISIVVTFQKNSLVDWFLVILKTIIASTRISLSWDCNNNKNSCIVPNLLKYHSMILHSQRSIIPSIYRWIVNHIQAQFTIFMG